MSIIGGCNLAICHRSAILHLLSFLLSGIQYTLNTAPSLPTLKISFNSPYQILLNSRSILCQYLVLSACDALSPCDAVAGTVRCGVWGQVMTISQYQSWSRSRVPPSPSPATFTRSCPSVPRSSIQPSNLSPHLPTWRLLFICNNCCLNKGRSEQGWDCAQEEQYKL